MELQWWHIILAVFVALFARDLNRWIRTGYFNEQRHIEDLEDLVAHCWVYSGYRDCGSRKMTKEQRTLYEKTIERRCADL